LKDSGNLVYRPARRFLGKRGNDDRIRIELLLIAGGALALLSVLAAPAVARPAQVPNFQSGPGGWTHLIWGDFPAVQGSAIPVREYNTDPAESLDGLVEFGGNAVREVAPPLPRI
jgi:hypothetical protein